MWALRFEEVTKTYPMAGRRYRSLRAEVRTAAGRLGGRASRAGRARGATPGEASAASEAWAAGLRPALDRVSFEVAEGEAVAVIGPNGAGKSTALRVAARVTAPTSGRVRRRGRVGALIEVGAGIHPELTGRENIWLYGAILGLSRREIASRFDAMVDFAEVGAVLDEQVKRYSSGMQLRLGFAIAAGIEPDVLVVDEALAVGDARFQLRCLERMAELVRSGTTLLYVSHDLASVQATCARGVLLIHGRVAHDGPACDAIDAYLHWVASVSGAAPASGAPATHAGGDRRGKVDGRDASGRVAARPCVVGGDGRARAAFRPGDEVVVRVPLPAGRRGPLSVALGIRDGHAWNVVGSAAVLGATDGGPPGEEAWCRIRSLPLGAGVYQVWASVDGDGLDGAWRHLGGFRVEEPGAPPRPVWLPPVAFDHEWTVGHERPASEAPQTGHA